MNELHKMPDVIFLISGTVLVVIALNVGITILLVRHHIQKYKDRLSRARTEAERDRLTGLYNRNGFERRAITSGCCTCIFIPCRLRRLCGWRDSSAMHAVRLFCMPGF